MKYYNIDELLKMWNIENSDWTITVVNLDPVIQEEPKHVTDNFNEQYPAGQ